jgi:hypothetical protein
MVPIPTFSFDMSHAPMEGWNLSLYGSNSSYAPSGAYELEYYGGNKLVEPINGLYLKR